VHKPTGSPLVDVILADVNEITARVDLGELKGKSVLVTGASGLIGTYLLACVNNTSNDFLSSTDLYGVVHHDTPDHYKRLFGSAGIYSIQGDLTDPAFQKTLPNADYIIHAAGYAQPGRFMEDPVKTIELNTTVTISLLNKLNPGGKFLYVSSSEVYSGLTRVPYTEADIGTTNTNHSRSCYIESKRCGEAICNAYREMGVQAKSARLALAYGPGTRIGDKRVLNAFVEKAFGGSITLRDQGEAKRTYCYVADAVEIMWSILLTGKKGIYNVGGESRTTIGDLAIQIGEIIGVPVLFPEQDEDVEGAPDDVLLDMSLVRHEFRKERYVPMTDGLERTIEWQRALYGLP
jgi:UDP-glucuronate decarboxylase